MSALHPHPQVQATFHAVTAPQSPHRPLRLLCTEQGRGTALNPGSSFTPVVSVTYAWSGSQLRAVTHLLWPVSARPTCFPVLGSHRRICGTEAQQITLPSLPLAPPRAPAHRPQPHLPEDPSTSF